MRRDTCKHCGRVYSDPDPLTDTERKQWPKHCPSDDCMGRATIIRITSTSLERWRKRWPCSTLETGWFEIAGNGDLVDMGGRLARGYVDAHELNAYQSDHATQQKGRSN